jgi:glycosyltransferase involved in cell wall biosynthesis
MKIGIVLHPYGEDKPAGLGRYIFDLTKSLLEKDKKNDYIIYLKKKPKKLPAFLGSNWRVEILGFGRFWMNLGLFFSVRSDVYVFNTPVIPLFFKPKKMIVIALDFAYKYIQPKGLKDIINNYLLFKMNAYALKKADKIISISEFTKKEIKKFFNVKGEKIKVVYPGFKNICSIQDNKIKLPKDFFLYVGVIKERKNLLNIVKGFAEFIENNKKGFKLVVVGKGSGEYFKKIMTFIEEKKIKNEIIFLNFVKDKELSYIYKKAKALVFPSFLEGFGFPILEAMACGVPVITSSRGSLSEVAGDAAILVDPNNFKDISESMRKMTVEDNLVNELIEKGIIRQSKFTWDKCSSEFKEILDNII